MPRLDNTVPTIVNKILGRRLRGLPAKSRARFAAELMSGELVITDLTARQAAALTATSVPQVNAARRALAGGASLAELRRKRAIDKRIDSIVSCKGGLERLVARLDELTQPTKAAAE